MKSVHFVRQPRQTLHLVDDDVAAGLKSQKLAGEQPRIAEISLVPKAGGPTNFSYAGEQPRIAEISLVKGLVE